MTCYFEEGTDESIALRLKWHTIAVNLKIFSSFLFFSYLLCLLASCCYLSFLPLFFMPQQAAQMTHMLEGRLRLPWRRLIRREPSKKYPRPICEIWGPRWRLLSGGLRKLRVPALWPSNGQLGWRANWGKPR